MTTDRLKKTLGNYKWSLLVGLLMLVMIGFGYQLARMVDAGDRLTLIAQDKTIALLVEENSQLTTKANRLDIELALATAEKQSMKAALLDAQREIAPLQEQVAFYQRVMAPEKSQDGLVIEGVEVTPTAESNQYQLRLALIQLRQNKAVVNGKLRVTISGMRDGERIELEMSAAGFSTQDIAYRFKYFQAVQTTFTLPDAFTPISIDLDTIVYQYKTRKGNFAKSVKWDDAFNTGISSEG